MDNLCYMLELMSLSYQWQCSQVMNGQTVNGRAVNCQALKTTQRVAKS